MEGIDEDDVHVRAFSSLPIDTSIPPPPPWTIDIPQSLPSVVLAAASAAVVVVPQQEDTEQILKEKKEDKKDDDGKDGLGNGKKRKKKVGTAAQGDSWEGLEHIQPIAPRQQQQSQSSTSPKPISPVSTASSSSSSSSSTSTSATPSTVPTVSTALTKFGSTPSTRYNNTALKSLDLPPPPIVHPRPVFSTLYNVHELFPPPPPTPPLEESMYLQQKDESDETDPLISTPMSALTEDEKEFERQLQEDEKMRGVLNLKQVLKNLKSKNENPTYDFVYADKDCLENEVNEFFNIPNDFILLEEGKAEYDQAVEDNWLDISDEERQTHLKTLLQRLTDPDPQLRQSSLKVMFYIAMGVCTECRSRSEQLDHIRTNNGLIQKVGALEYYYEALKHASNTFDVLSPSETNSSPTSPSLEKPSLEPEEMRMAMNATYIEISLTLSLMFLLVEAESDSDEFAITLCQGSSPLVLYLFQLVSKLSDPSRRNYPIRKLIVLLWKVLLCIIGAEREKRLEVKNYARSLYGLMPIVDGKQPYAKCNPIDYMTYFANTTHKYPGYVLPPPNKVIHSPYVDVSLLPVRERPVIQPFIDPIRPYPKAIDDAIQVFEKSMYVKLANIQLRKEVIAMEQSELNPTVGSKIQNEVLPEQVKSSTPLTNPIRQRHEGIENMYALLLPTLPDDIGMLIRLLYHVNLGAHANGPNNHGDQPASPEGSAESADDDLEFLEFSRHKEVVTKAVTGILFCLLKASKLVHICAFEYVSQLMMDSNTAIIALKMLSGWFQTKGGAANSNANEQSEAAAEDKESGGVSKQSPVGIFCSKKNERKLDLIYYCSDLYADGGDEKHVEVDENANPANKVIPASWRNFYTSITLLRILHKLTKDKLHRTLMLVQWKSSAVLKRVCKVNHHGLHLYALKVLRSQIPYLGKKWKSSNMRLITNIYIHLRPDLKNEWLYEDAEVDVEEASLHEQMLRNIVSSYHQRAFPAVAHKDSSSGDNRGNTNEEEPVSVLPSRAHANPALVRGRKSLSPVRNRQPSLTGVMNDELERLVAIARRDATITPKFLEQHFVSRFLHQQQQQQQSSSSSTDSEQQKHLDDHFMENYQSWLKEEVLTREDEMCFLSSSESEDDSAFASYEEIEEEEEEDEETLEGAVGSGIPMLYD